MGRHCLPGLCQQSSSLCVQLKLSLAEVPVTSCAIIDNNIVLQTADQVNILPHYNVHLIIQRIYGTVMVQRTPYLTPNSLELANDQIHKHVKLTSPLRA